MCVLKQKQVAVYDFNNETMLCLWQRDYSKVTNTCDCPAETVFAFVNEDGSYLPYPTDRTKYDIDTSYCLACPENSKYTIDSKTQKRNCIADNTYTFDFDTFTVSSCGVGFISSNNICIACRFVTQTVNNKLVTLTSFSSESFYFENYLCEPCPIGAGTKLPESNDCDCLVLNKIWIRADNRCDSCFPHFITTNGFDCVECDSDKISVKSVCS